MPANTTESDEAVQLIRAKSDAGFQWLIEHVGPRVKGMLIRKLGSCSGDSFETAIVEAAETLWLRGKPYDPERGSLVAWLYTATYRICLNMYRAAKARPLISSMPGDLMASMYDERNSTQLRSERIEGMLEDLRACIAQLTPREEEVILATLGEFNGTDTELGERLGTSDNVIRVTRTRAHKKLAKLMRGMHVDG